MRYGIFSDVHSNLNALQAVLEAMESENIDKKYFLGDAVGYASEPNECLQLIREHSQVLLGGNHDYAAVGKTDTSYFNPYAKKAIDWTEKTLTAENKSFLKTLPVKLVDDDITLAHSSPKEPEKWHYISSLKNAEENFNFFQTRLCFIGHSHSPLIVEQDPMGRYRTSRGGTLSLQDENKYLINDGSVGQPRDGNPLASYCVYDSDTNKIEFKRVAYDIEGQQERMRKAGLPDYLIDRIAFGR